MKALYTTKAQRAAIRAEAQKQVYEARDKLFNDMDAVIMWVLHEEFGFGNERLRRFFDAFIREYRGLQEFYELVLIRRLFANKSCLKLGWISTNGTQTQNRKIQVWQNLIAPRVYPGAERSREKRRA